MKSLAFAPLGLVLGVALVPVAAAQNALLTAPKVACTPDRMTRCTAADQCTTTAATAKDKTEVLVIDFAAKKASIRKNGQAKEFGAVIDETVEGGIRKFAVGQGSQKMLMTLTGDGKLTLMMGGAGNRAEATCTAES
ncbi:MAG: hypothetical protein KIT16_14510 [Rhodospirillaceae bacterium]|nr:hypothetical protein [Rhodospirillaceae bacterium]